jgi:hypothetical protein
MQSGKAEAGPTKLPALLAGGQNCLLQAFRWQQLLLFTLVFFVIVPRVLAGQQAEDLDATVEYLITYVKESDVAFERNSTRYNGIEAAEHINMKYRHFKDDIDTPEKFIALCATGSLVTGKPYFIITREGEQLPSSEWLNAALAGYRSRYAHTGP